MSWVLEEQKRRAIATESTATGTPSCLVSWLLQQSPVNQMPQECTEHILRHKQSQKLAHKEPQQLEQQSIDTEAGMLSGISQKHNMRSSPCRFTEFCNSQCLSHFAAPFIVDRTETSIAESCKSQLARARWQQTENCKATKRQWKRREITTRMIQIAPPPTSICLGARTGHPHTDPHRKVHSGVFGTCANDPSAGSPTETLLRLLLPLSDKVH